MQRCFVFALFGASLLSASTITYNASGTSSGGNTENASAVFTTGAGTINITLNNLIQNPQDVGQNISDLFFSLSGISNPTGTLSSSSGTELTVNSNGTFSTGSSVSTGWQLTTSSGQFLLEVLGTPEAPKHTIIGTSSAGNYTSGTYSNANASIAGNGPHNPFLESGTTFSISAPSVTTSTTITAATFSFGTEAGNTRVGVPVSSVPEPTTMLLMGGGLVGIALIRKSARKQS